uniref:putative 1-phosphatidylinositol-3-phosphate 5-kinase FAB1D isoform X2 n=1 Tax=Erigeron canadensis TaxID=72917 RepID=UPI001CB909B1|nr:putative 1-phosphatidylinositol-3-phosphate 5-kinase FAB1D isoform X2 [Erigeron canadensis]
MTYDTLISPPASAISPAVSLAKSDSSVSYYNDDYLADVSSYERSNSENFSLHQHQPYLGYGVIDSHIWFPPEPEDEEDDIEGSFATYEDDDDEEYGDGMKWGKPSNLSSFGKEGSTSFMFRDETRKAMNEVMNGKFKALVENLLESMGLSSNGNDSESWVDIVTALSWDAASYLRPDAFEGKEMDPDGYVKVKCIATGTRTQSEVFKGLVFKKHAAHKHMPTEYRKPKLLLIRGALSVSSDGLSSFDTMKQEADRVDSLIGIIEKMNPNVVLVEKTVSRDIQESILAKGMTLVLEMKQHRLERVARCTGSPILSSDNLIAQNLLQCESFYFEKIVEEHAGLSENGKKSKKTLMFLKGCPTRMGFTILLKGSHSDELKRVKCVVQFAVIMAYHLILENSFILNQRAMFSTTAPNGMAIFSNKDKEITPSVINQPLYDNLDDPNVPITNDSSSDTDLISTVDIPISNGSDENESDNLGLEGSTLSSYEPYDPIVLSGLSSLSSSWQKVVGFPLFDTAHQSMSAYLGYNGVNTNKHTQASVNELSSPEAVETDGSEVKVDLSQADTHENGHIYSSATLRNSSSEARETEEHLQRKNDISAVFDSESILVLMSRRNVIRGTTCKQSSFSCIKFYRHFDVPLGKFLRDNLLNQKLKCGTCNELPEAHTHYYAHYNMQLTIQVKRLPLDKHLTGETEGKIWMWSCCGQCKPSNGSLKSTKRVLLSIVARGLSFGKFLELGLSNHTSWKIPSTCGHSFYRDYLHFFGLGSMVAMFRYSTVETYSVSLPPWRVEFRNSIEGNFLKEETDEVLREVHSVFSEVENSLKKMENEFVGMMLNLQGSSKRFCDIKEMLKQEQDQFQVDMENLLTSTNDVSVNRWLHKPLYLNLIQWELFLHSYIWDERLYSLLSSDLRVTNPQTSHHSLETESNFEDNDTTEPVQSGESVSDNIVDVETMTTEEGNSVPIEVISTEGNDGNVDQDDPNVSTQTLSTSADPNGWMWTPISQIQNFHLSDLRKGYLPKHEPTRNTPGSAVCKIFTKVVSQLHYPLATSNHLVSVYEDELSSMIACALAFIQDGNISSADMNDDLSSENLQNISPLSSTNWSFFTSMDTDSSSLGRSSDESRFSSFDGLDYSDSVTSSRHIHKVISMGRLNKKPENSVACVCAREFVNLRGQCGLSELDYISSLSHCKHWDAKGGKSKSFFAKTLDDRFIIKEIKNPEFLSFLGFASQYFAYMNQCFNSGNQTCLAKIFGVYQVKNMKSGVKHDLMVMENISYGRKFTKQYDLKGALHARFIAAAVGGVGDVLLDQNFVNDMNNSPLYVNRRAKRNLQRAVWNDTVFLESIKVMDYSLLVGVDAEQKELVCGIIDYLRQYTWDKQLENKVKSFVVPKNQMPTIISPIEYKKRFKKFMDTHFFSVPDDWCSQRSSNRCSLCRVGSHENSQELDHDDHEE